MDFMHEHLAHLERWNYLVSLAAVVAFAVTGVLAITEDHDSDLVSALVFGIITGIGGGTIRDLIIDVPPLWAVDQSYLGVAAGASVIAFYWRRQIREHALYSVMTYLDGLGAAMFSVQATGKVWFLDFARPGGPILLGVITAIGGGLLRDVLAGRPTLLMRPELYATPVLLGCTSSTLLLWLAPERWRTGSLVCMAAAFALRAAAIRWGLTVPRWARSGRMREGG